MSNLIEDPSSIRHIVTHADCPDGMASALVLREAFPDATVTFVQYGKLQELRPEPGMLFCDIAPAYEHAQAFVDVGAYVLDHHGTARTAVARFGERGVFSDENGPEPQRASGALLAYRNVESFLSPEVRPVAERVATLADIRDTWKTKDEKWQEACAQASLLMLVPQQNDLGKWTLEQVTSEMGLRMGTALHERRVKEAKTALQNALRWKTDLTNLRCAIISSSSLTSDAIELDSNIEVLFGFSYTASALSPKPVKLIVSCRSRGFDVATLAKKHGGGGHTRAAGFAIDDSLNSPYAVILSIVADYEMGAVVGSVRRRGL